jgi:hypothetical protein
MKTYQLLPQFKMSQSEIESYNTLPDNLPDTRLTQKQKDLVYSLYYQYIEKHIDNRDWSIAMYKAEQSEKWPSGPRVKDHEAKRMVLGWLVQQQSHPVLSDEQAADLFFGSLRSRPMYAKLINSVYDRL